MDVSFIMPNYNCARYLRAAISSALDQTVQRLEVIIVDDASTDDSISEIKELASQWPDTIRLFQLPKNQGSAAARNMALAHARGRWIAVLDSDDLIHPHRLARLISKAEAVGADMIVDDMVTFYDDHSRSPHRLLGGIHSKRPGWVSLAEYVENNRFYSPHPPLGYLKPVWRADRLRASGVFYDGKLRLAQDYDFVLRLLEAGLTLWIEPEPLYFYRKHSTSNSYRTNPDRLESIIKADHDFVSRTSVKSKTLVHAIRRRRASLYDAFAFDKLVAGLKTGRPALVLQAICTRPQCLTLLREPVRVRIKRWTAKPLPMPTFDVAVLGDGKGVGGLINALQRIGLSSRPVRPGPSLLTKALAPFDTAAWVEVARELATVKGPTLVVDINSIADASFNFRPTAARVAFVSSGEMAGEAKGADIILVPDASAAAIVRRLTEYGEVASLDMPSEVLVAKLLTPIDPAARVRRRRGLGSC